jgi:UDP-N-acetyl-D-glucosamine dehydrogenase
MRGEAMQERLFEALRSRSARVAVLGQGYVGLVVAMRASEAGFDVVGLELDETRSASLRAGRSYVEDVPDETLRAALDRGYRPSDDPEDLAGYDVAVISVPTPLADGAPDLSFIEHAGRLAGRHLDAGSLVVLESTTYPGTTEELLGPLLEECSGLSVGEDFLLGYSPERIDPGNPTYGLHNTPKVVAGVDAASTAAVETFYGAFVERVVTAPGCGEAELTKVIENTFRHVNIALVNEIAMFARDLGLDINAAIDAAETKPFGFMPFRPGPGVGGHCLPVDPSYLSWRVKMSLGEHFRFIELANDINDHMPHYVVRRVTARLNDDHKSVNGSRIVVLGVSYKPNVGDTRETPARPLVEQLLHLGAEVTVVDGFAASAGTFAGAPIEAKAGDELLSGSDLVVVITDHDDIDYDRVAELAPRVLDTRARLEPRHTNVERL